MKKTYCITDPCYILDDTTWDACCKKCDNLGDVENWCENFNKVAEEALKDFTQGQAFVSDTGFGDWDNTLYGLTVSELGAFCADAGEVCVCELTDEVAERLDDAFEHGRAASFEAEGPIKVNFDTTDPSWTVVYIEDADGTCWNTSTVGDEDEEE